MTQLNFDRYTLTYTPSLDSIIPSPRQLHVKIKNTTAIAYRAAYLHGPYALYVACYPSTFDPNRKVEKPSQSGIPQFEPQLKAGGSWNATLTVPDNIRETEEKANLKRNVDGSTPCVTWIIEISSQVIFSSNAAVHFELIVGRDETSLELGFGGLIGNVHTTPGCLQDHQQGKRNKHGHGAAQPERVYSRAIDLVVDDTESLWNNPTLPGWEDEGRCRTQKPLSLHADENPTISGYENRRREAVNSDEKRSAKCKKVHLVILTHGLLGNLGADMLYLKESIDSTVKQARIDARKRKATSKAKLWKQSVKSKAEPSDSASKSWDKLSSGLPLSSNHDQIHGIGDESGDNDDDDDDDDEEEDVVVRGFNGNATRTERGIQYLGKRLAKHVLSMTYPDQPFLPMKKAAGNAISRALARKESTTAQVKRSVTPPISSQEEAPSSRPAYQITSISFIGHSLGGLAQTYAVAYIHKHSPHFFERIRPVNFVALASPFLGLSNENPIYVKFALNFGLVGRTGQDLGLTWRPPTMVRSGWDAIIGGIGTESQRAHKVQDPRSKPLLRVLPTGPAHEVLKMFRNRTVYSNVVNDGIVPLRTSCLLFLDWQGLGRVENARRENGLVRSVAGWGWAELTGANSTAHKSYRKLLEGGLPEEMLDQQGSNTPTMEGDGDVVPQPPENATREDNASRMQQKQPTLDRSFSAQRKHPYDTERGTTETGQRSHPTSPLASLFGFLRSGYNNHSHRELSKQPKIYGRSQTMKFDDDEENSLQNESIVGSPDTPQSEFPGSEAAPEDLDAVFTPPRTSVFEAAGDLLNPPLPSEQYLIDPTSRPRTIFHDRVYLPEDIPPPPLRQRSSIMRSFSGDGKDHFIDSHYPEDQSSGSSGLKVEEKIARAYHRDLPWRKVLVRLEPDAHNNIVVRRMFSNAYGWPVVKHLVDTHFADTLPARTADDKESSQEHALPIEKGVGEHGEEVQYPSQTSVARTQSESRELDDVVHTLKSPPDTIYSSGSRRPRFIRDDSAQWDDQLFEGTDDDDDEVDLDRTAVMPFTTPPAAEHNGPETTFSHHGDTLPAKTAESAPSPWWPQVRSNVHECEQLVSASSNSP